MCVLKVKEYGSIDKAFLFTAAYIKRGIGYLGEAKLTAVHAFYPSVVTYSRCELRSVIDLWMSSYNLEGITKKRNVDAKENFCKLKDINNHTVKFFMIDHISESK